MCAAPLDEVFSAATSAAAVQGVISFADKKTGVISVVVGTTIAHPTLSIKLTSVSDDTKTNVAIKTQGFQVGFGGAGRAKREFLTRLTDELKKDGA